MEIFDIRIITPSRFNYKIINGEYKRIDVTNPPLFSTLTIEMDITFFNMPEDLQEYLMLNFHLIEREVNGILDTMYNRGLTSKTGTEVKKVVLFGTEYVVQHNGPSFRSKLRLADISVNGKIDVADMFERLLEKAYREKFKREFKLFLKLR